MHFHLCAQPVAGCSERQQPRRLPPPPPSSPRRQRPERGVAGLAVTAPLPQGCSAAWQTVGLHTQHGRRRQAADSSHDSSHPLSHSPLIIRRLLTRLDSMAHTSTSTARRGRRPPPRVHATSRQLHNRNVVQKSQPSRLCFTIPSSNTAFPSLRGAGEGPGAGPKISANPVPIPN
jgi:hypothetical protein